MLFKRDCGVTSFILFLCVCYQMSPSQRAVKCKMEPQAGKADVNLVRFTPTEEGVHAVNVSYDGHPVPGSPFPVDAQLPPDPSKVTSASVYSTMLLYCFFSFLFLKVVSLSLV